MKPSDIDNRAAKSYMMSRRNHWDRIGRRLDHWQGWSAYYHLRLAKVYRHITVPHQSILEIGCGQGDLLAALQPALGVGVDFSHEMIRRAKKRHPNLHFFEADAHNLCIDAQFDVVIFSDLLNDLWDVQTIFEQIASLVHPRTRVIINSYNRLWEIPLALASRFHLAKPNLVQNWLTVEDIINLLDLSGFELIQHWEEVLWPISTPILSTISNQFLVRLWPFRYLALTNVIVARPKAKPVVAEQDVTVSVIIPARNEAGNIDAIFRQVPEMGRETELIFVEGHSKDNTYEIIEHCITANKHRKTRLLKQDGEGKGDAVRKGFEQASGEVLMILDADLTVPPEDLLRFFRALISGKGEFVNGVRMVYPLEDQSMRFINLVGNKFFSLAFTWLLGQTIKDTLCGTKVLWRKDYQLLKANRAYFGDFDPFGDFDLLLGVAKQRLKIVDMPIRYRSRTYGDTNIQRWKHGFLLLRMLGFAARRLKFV